MTPNSLYKLLREVMIFMTLVRSFQILLPDRNKYHIFCKQWITLDNFQTTQGRAILTWNTSTDKKTDPEQELIGSQVKSRILWAIDHAHEQENAVQRRSNISALKKKLMVYRHEVSNLVSMHGKILQSKTANEEVQHKHTAHVPKFWGKETWTYTIK